MERALTKIEALQANATAGPSSDTPVAADHAALVTRHDQLKVAAARALSDIDALLASQS